MAVPLPLQAMYGARPTARGTLVMEWRIHEPSKWRPPRARHPRMEQLLWESLETGVLLVPLHLHLGCDRFWRHVRGVNGMRK